MAKPIPLQHLPRILRGGHAFKHTHVRIEPEVPVFDAIVCIIVAAGIGAMLAVGGAF